MHFSNTVKDSFEVLNKKFVDQEAELEKKIEKVKREMEVEF